MWVRSGRTAAPVDVQTATLRTADMPLLWRLGPDAGVIIIKASRFKLTASDMVPAEATAC